MPKNYFPYNSGFGKVPPKLMVRCLQSSELMYSNFTDKQNRLNERMLVTAHTGIPGKITEQALCLPSGESLDSRENNNLL